MSYMYPWYAPVELATSSAGYGLVRYREAGQPPPEPLPHHPRSAVLFLPGNAGSASQVRSLGAAAAAISSPLAWFALDVDEEKSALQGQRLLAQASAAIDALRELSAAEGYSRWILIGHSMGGITARLVPQLLASAANEDTAALGASIAAVVTLATPHAAPVVTADGTIESIYALLAHPRDTAVPVVSISGGPRDELIPAHLTHLALPRGHLSLPWLHVPSLALPGSWRSADHLCILWCRELVTAVAGYVDNVARSGNGWADALAAFAPHRALPLPRPGGESEREDSAQPVKLDRAGRARLQPHVRYSLPTSDACVGFIVTARAPAAWWALDVSGETRAPQPLPPAQATTPASDDPRSAVLVAGAARAATAMWWPGQGRGTPSEAVLLCLPPTPAPGMPVLQTLTSPWPALLPVTELSWTLERSPGWRGWVATTPVDAAGAGVGAPAWFAQFAQGVPDGLAGEQLTVFGDEWALDAPLDALHVLWFPECPGSAAACGTPPPHPRLSLHGVIRKWVARHAPALLPLASVAALACAGGLSGATTTVLVALASVRGSWALAPSPWHTLTLTLGAACLALGVNVVARIVLAAAGLLPIWLRCGCESRLAARALLAVAAVVGWLAEWCFVPGLALLVLTLRLGGSGSGSAWRWSASLLGALPSLANAYQRPAGVCG
ncbi:uncharacterized protein AMSG_01041 [Thecamonas trahens ATCC 50062]|uniref:GPI inositol-deacylase n=1 Tax=Thecamonas trahens ATCC 50062 TaxID=461836 RepID=A0A0L0DLE4_THETB|nr:hypothetical protein AMSG_01041 [Thecamonas trahens ATCC 50062]KNC52213.1 hypothetical protein AMSG_01041 [Thecamonas trahens ATCC 50062]|eukprot:XP_013762216.1 hypothetical protein AMSG_01041 [Thecamonas trahens ATCC 50062]